MSKIDICCFKYTFSSIGYLLTYVHKHDHIFVSSTLLQIPCVSRNQLELIHVDLDTVFIQMIPSPRIGAILVFRLFTDTYILFVFGSGISSTIYSCLFHIFTYIHFIGIQKYPDSSWSKFFGEENNWKHS